MTEQESTGVFIQEAEEGDLSQLVEIEKEATNNGLYSGDLTEQEWREALKKGKTYFIKEKEHVVGEFSIERKKPNHAYLAGLVIKPEFQGKGYGRKSMEIILGSLVEDCQEIDLVVHPDNVRAINLYASCGFKIGPRMENYFGDGEPRLEMRLVRPSFS